MISVRRSEIPLHLQFSEFYKALDGESDEPVDIDPRHFRLELSIETYEDLEHCLATFRFWGVTRIGDELVEYCVKQPLEAMRAADAFPELLFVDHIIQVINTPNHCKLIKAAELGNVDLLSWLHRNNIGKVNTQTAIVSARYGYIDCLQFAIEQGCQLIPAVAEIACQSGHIECLKYLHSVGCPWSKRATAAAAGVGRLDILQYLHEHGCEWDQETTRTATIVNSLDCLRYAHEHGCPWSSSVTYEAASRGYLQLLTYANEHGCPASITTAEKAAENGHLACLQYALEHNCAGNLANVCAAAAEGGHLECLQYAYDHGCPLRSERVTELAAKRGQFACLRYAVAHGCPLSGNVMRTACSSDNLEIVQYLREVGVEWHAHSMSSAMYYGRAAILAYGLQNGAPRPHVSGMAKFECVKIAFEHGCGWQENFFADALAKGRLETVQFAHEHGCAWSEADFVCAVACPSVECVRYLYEHGCPYREADLLEVVFKMNLEVFQYAVEVMKLPVTLTTLGLHPDMREYLERTQQPGGK